ncbi:MAG TPA: DUF58 domain-containing protein [Thermoanaerobaculia bacterium]|jgi:uncharacterized protein (DUF58 family)
MRPGAGLIRAFAIVAAAALLVPLADAFAWVLAGMTIAILLAAAAEALLLRRVRIDVERQPKVAIPLDEHDTAPLRITTSATRTLKLTARQRWPELVEPGATVAAATIRPGEALPLEFSVRGLARGTAPIPPLHVAITFFGLIERIVAAGTATEVHVMPNLKAVGRMHKRLNQFALRSLGARTAPRIGKGREFDRLRDYLVDDDYRDVAWRASARHGRLIVREFRLDRAQDVLICVDRGHRMAARVAHISRLDHAVNASVLISYVCSRMEDNVGIVSFDATVDRGLAGGRGSSHLRAITSYAGDLAAQYRPTDYLMLASSLRRRLRHRTLILILTVLPEREERGDLLRAVGMLAPQHLPLFVVLTDRELAAQASILPSNETELSRTLVARDLVLGRVELIREIRARGAMVVESTADDWGVDAVNSYIDVKRRQML